MNTLTWFACCSMGLLLGCAGTQHISLVSPGTSAAGRPRHCRPSPPDSCSDTTTDVPSDQNREGTKFINLPSTCSGRIHRIVIHDVSSKAPVAYVECAATENNITDTRPAAATEK